MPLPIDYRPRRNDILTVRGKVMFDVDAAEDVVHLKIVGSHSSSVAVALANVIDVHAKHFDVGDKVRAIGNGSGYGVGEVLATHDGKVWVIWPATDPKTFPAFELVAFDDAPPMPAPLSDSVDDAPIDGAVS